MPARACPYCRGLMEVPAELLTRAVECPTCAKTFTPDAPRTATVLAVKPAAPIPAVVPARPAARDDRDDDRDDRPRPARKRKTKLEKETLATVMGGGGFLALVIILAVVRVAIRAENRRASREGNNPAYRDYSPPQQDPPAFQPFPPPNPVSPPPPKPVPPPPPPVKWQKVTTADGFASIDLPTGKRSTATDQGATVETFEWAAADGTASTLVSLSFAAGAGKQNLDAIVERHKQNRTAGGATVKRDDRIACGRGTGREIEFADPKQGTIVSRILQFEKPDGDRVLTVSAGGGLGERFRVMTSMAVADDGPTPKLHAVGAVFTPPVFTPPKPPKPKSDLPDGWQRYELPDKSAAVAMPGAPTPKETDLGGGLKMTVADYTTPDGALVYAISSVPQPVERFPQADSPYIKAARATLLQSFGRKPDRDNAVVVPGRIGQELEYRNPDGTGVRVRYFKVTGKTEARVFAVTMTGKLPPVGEKDVFGESFKITWP